MPVHIILHLSECCKEQGITQYKALLSLNDMQRSGRVF